MGMEQAVIFTDQPVPSWPVLKEFLDRRGFPVLLRMIDGELAFPDENPPETWRELRVGTPHGMVTLRHEKARLTFVTWGNADGALVQAWNGLAWAAAELGGGRIESGHGLFSAAAFRAAADLPAPLRGEP
jgi:hypothetical protein